jgi:hypothetical protein
MRRTLLALAVLTLTAVACGDDGGTTVQAVDRVRAASAATADAGTAIVSYHAEVEGLPERNGIDSFEFEGEGLLDFESGTGSMTMEFPDLPGIPDGSTMESLFEGNVTYLRAEIFGPLPDDAEWVRMDLEELMDEEAGIDLGQVQQGSSDPSNSLALLEGASENGLEDLGQEEIDGVTATHYRADIDLSEAYEQSDAISDPEAFEQFTEMFGEDDTIETHVWLDDDGRVVQQSYRQPFPIVPGADDVTMEVTMGFTDFGEPVEVDFPDDDETVDLLDLMNEQQEF